MLPRRDVAAALIAVGGGVAVAWLDSRPGFDDTGVTAVALAMIAAVAAAVAGRRPVVWAIAAGAWVPILEVRDVATSGALLALAVSGVGATVGWLLVARTGAR